VKKRVNKKDELARAIAELERKEAIQKTDLQNAYSAVSESLKPLNLVKSGVRSIFSGEHKEDLVNGLIGLGTGFLSRKLLLGKRNGVVGKTVGKAIQWGMAGFVSKNAEKIKEKAGDLIDKLFKKKNQPTNHAPASKTQRVTPDS